jgi:glucose-6-phosphate dehydrogenase assembly protein OpcA
MDIERFTGGEDQPVDVAAIERELTGLWRTVGQRGDGDRTVTRASALNLVVPCAGDAVEETRSVVAELVGTHPARVLLLVTEPGEGTMTASVSAFCHRLGTAAHQVCCELITLRARGPAEEHLPEAVLALLAPDLPVAVWWPGGLPMATTPPLFERLAPLADRYVIDTATAPDATALWQTAELFALGGGMITGFAAGDPLGGIIHDLAWMRLLPWRELTAQFFDPRAFRARLPELDLLEVRTPAHTPPRAEALLWISWMADRLEWRPALDSSPREASASGTSWRFLRPGGVGHARVLPPESTSSDADALPGVRLQASSSETAFTITRAPDADCATLTVTTRDACPLPRAVSLPRPRTAQLLAAALDEPQADPLYLAALALAAELQA